MVAPGDTLADYDSLAIALRDHGFSTLLLNVRGSGWSVAPACPLPEAWNGREETMTRRVARDVRDAVRATGLATRIDTSSVVLVATRSLALSGAMAAAQDRRVRALILLSPDPDAVERGPLIATLARRRLPVFLQQTPEDYQNFEVIDRAYHVTPESQSRVSDALSSGSGAIAFRFDRRTTPRLIQWIGETLKAPAPPRARPRKG